MKTSKIVKKHIQTLEHFLEQGGHPIKMAASEFEELCSLGFPLKHGNLSGTAPLNIDCIVELDETKQWDWELVAEFWKYRFQEEFNEVKRIYNIIDTAYRKL